MTDKITYIPEGTCSRKIDIDIDESIITNVEFQGGCPGNLLGITRLVAGMKIQEILDRFEGLKCGSRSTSCPDQLARALRGYLENVSS